MIQEPTTAEKLRKLPWSIVSDAANSAYAQLTFFGSIFVLFLNELNLDKSQIGFLLSIMTLVGLLALFVAGPAARFGAKRTYITFWGIRKAVTVLLLFTPWMVMRYGPQATLFYVAGIILLFAICRAVAVTAFYPWVQEYVPASVRGRYSAANNIFVTLSSLLAVAMAALVLERVPGLNGFMLLFAIGIAFGVVAVWTAVYIPGGAPAPPNQQVETRASLLTPLRDADFTRYIGGAALMTLAVVPLASFLPLFMQEQVGLGSSHVVWLQTGTMLGGLLFTFFWGWAADRYGSRPVILSGVLMLAVLPLFWMLIPRHSPSSLYVALAIAFVQGIANISWAIGAGRLLFVNIVPTAHKTVYMAVYYAPLEVVSGLSQIVGGQIVQLSAGLTGQLFIFTLDPYTVLFVLGALFPLLSLILLRNIRADTGMHTRQFVGLFLRGNAFLAMRSLARFHLTGSEAETISTAERMGSSRSLLTVEELLALLEDPRFNVRFEAVISIARTRQDARLTAALVEVIEGTDLALKAMAIWALGRIGDRAAIEPLRRALDSPYLSIRAHAVRALATLGDRDIGPPVLERLLEEPDENLRLAYGASLGRLGFVEASPVILRLFKSSPDQGARLSLSLALAQLWGNESRFIRLWRQMRFDAATTSAQIVADLNKRLERQKESNEALRQVLVACETAFAAGAMEQGAALLRRCLAQLPLNHPQAPPAEVLHPCAEGLNGAEFEHLLLILHLLDMGWRKR